MHYFETIFVGHLFLPATDTVLQVLYGRLELSVLVLELILTGLDSFVLLGIFLLLLCEAFTESTR